MATERADIIFSEMYTTADIIKGNNAEMHENTWYMARDELEKEEKEKMNEKKCGVDGAIKVPNWELVGKEVYIVEGNAILKHRLNRIEVAKIAKIDGTIAVNIAYLFEGNRSFRKDNVYPTKEACAEAWLKKQGVEVRLRDSHEKEI